MLGAHALVTSGWLEKVKYEQRPEGNEGKATISGGIAWRVARPCLFRPDMFGESSRGWLGNRSSIHSAKRGEPLSDVNKK